MVRGRVLLPRHTFLQAFFLWCFLCFFSFAVVASCVSGQPPPPPGECESIDRCSACVAQPGGACEWCSVVGVCLNATGTYSGQSASVACTVLSGGSGSLQSATCTAPALQELCSAKYGDWDCAGCGADSSCGWCGGGSVDRCLQDAGTGICAPIFGGSAAAPCPAQCAGTHGRNCSQCAADAACVWCGGGEQEQSAGSDPGTCLDGAGSAAGGSASNICANKPGSTNFNVSCGISGGGGFTPTTGLDITLVPAVTTGQALAGSTTGASGPPQITSAAPPNPTTSPGPGVGSSTPTTGGGNSGGNSGGGSTPPSPPPPTNSAESDDAGNGPLSGLDLLLAVVLGIVLICCLVAGTAVFLRRRANTKPPQRPSRREAMKDRQADEWQRDRVSSMYNAGGKAAVYDDDSASFEESSSEYAPDLGE